QRVLVHGAQHRRRNGGDVGAHLGGLDDVADVAHRGDQDFGVEVGIGVVDLHDLGDELQAVGTGVVESSDEGRDVGSAGLGGEDCLRGGEAEGYVHLDAVVAQRLAGLQA